MCAYVNNILFNTHGMNIKVIKMDLQKVGCEGMDWINLAQDRDKCLALVNAVMNLQVP